MNPVFCSLNIELSVYLFKNLLKTVPTVILLQKNKGYRSHCLSHWHKADVQSKCNKKDGNFFPRCI